MSRTTQSEILENPCKKFLQWKTIKETIKIDGDEVEKIKGGTFVYWDKDKEENFPIKLPLKFAILNPDLVCFKGYDEKNKRGVYSNEVKEPEHLVTVKSKKDILMTFRKGEYKVNKDTLKGLGAKYTQSVYIAVPGKDGFEIWNLQLSGAALTGANDMENKNPEEAEDGWFAFTKAHRNALYKNFLEVGGFKPKKKGSSKFTIPIYSVGAEIEDADSQELNLLDAQLNEYLDFYFKRPAKEEGTVETHASAPVDVDTTDY